MSDPSLTARYNAPKKLNVPKRVKIIAGAAVLLAAIVAAAIFATNKYDALQAQDVGFTVLSEAQAVAEIEVQYDASKRIQCDVRAMNDSYAVVGFKTVLLPHDAQGGHTVQHLKVPLRTENLANTAGVESCYEVPLEHNGE
ncbi:DUF4307 domain-containing protein [Glutamicibacter endophyticus]|uniref:DUF4307 domain-containing protein n=1 Tax=Glutamicibacter endophyticus TaxID=1522174 RepID=UPI003AEF3381